MKQYLAISATIVVILGLLIALNTASYVQKPDEVDSEYNPNRSSYHSGPTGTRAFYEFLQESNYKTVRWRKPLSALLDENKVSRPQTMLVVGETRIPFDQQEELSLINWVAGGGRLVIIDRQPPMGKLPLLNHWVLTARTLQDPPFNMQPEKSETLIEGVKPVAPAQPALLTSNVETVQPSRYAARLIFSNPNSKEAAGKDEEKKKAAEEVAAEVNGPEDSGNAFGSAPVVHLADNEGALLLDYAYGAGRIIILSDPFMVANNGLNRADNLRLGLDLVGGRDRLIAFDEYHHGHGMTRTSLLTYFSGTPIPAIVAQLVLLTLIVVWARGRRFARPLPAPHVDRRSKLEFITSMAELQMRARAYDLALENIYTRTRRVLARASGTDASASRERIAERLTTQFSNVKREYLELLMRECENTIAGAPTGPRQSLELARRLRALETALGLRARKREIKQAAEKL